MSSRIEIAREAFIRSGSPLGLGNHGNRVMGKVLAGERRLTPNKKEQRARRNRDKQLKELEAWKASERAKLERVSERVRAVLDGHEEDYCLEGLTRQIGYLRNNGISIVPNEPLPNR